MQPTASDVHVSRPLTNISVGFVQNPAGFVATRVFPEVKVMHKADKYFQYDRGEFFRAQMQRRAPSTESAGGGYTVDSSPTYLCERWGLHKDIDDEVRANQDNPLDADRDAALWLSQQGLLRKEIEWASTYFTTGLWGTDITGVSGSPSSGQVKQWNDAASTPLEDIAAARDVVKQSTGYDPNKLTIGREVWTALKNHPDIVDRIKYSSGNDNPAMVNRRSVAALMEVEEILVMEAVQNTAAKGQTPSNSFIGGKKALLSYAPNRPSLFEPTAGYTFSWYGLLGSGALGTRIRKFRIDAITSDRVEIDMSFDQKLVASDMGYFFTSVVA